MLFGGGVLGLALLCCACTGHRVPSPRPETAPLPSAGPSSRLSADGASATTGAESAVEKARIAVPALRAPGLAALLPEPGREETVLRYGERRITRGDLFERLREREPAKAQELIELALLDARVHEIAEREKVFVPKGELRLALGRELARMRRAYQRRPEGAVDFDDFLMRSYGLDEAGARKRAELLAYRRLLRAYTVRFWLRQRGQVGLQLFVAADAEAAARAREQISLGADFAALAQKNSRDQSARGGGRLPQLPLGLGHPLEKLAQGVPVGGLSKIAAYGKAGPAFVRVLSRRAPDRRSFAEMAEDLRSELARQPIAAHELALFLAQN
ncbi:MAG: hypothetical protein CSA62_11025 [Planctomycetota bacterium]|nr:MAG: hypothetical protein CSA62_11025 [Planctomycetota bacterium]